MIETAPYDETHPLRVQHVTDIRYAPFYADLVQWNYATLLEPWPVLTSAARYDAAPLAPVEMFAAGEGIERFSVFGISIEGASGLRLYSDRPISALTDCCIAVDAQESDVTLLQIVLAYRYRVWPSAFVAPEMPHDALLSRNTVSHARYAYDIGEEWCVWQHLPLVETLWAIRSDAPALARGVINYLLGSSIQKAQRAPDTIAAQFGLKKNDVTDAVEHRRYRLNSTDHDSLSVLRRLWLNLPAQISALAPMPQLEKIAA